MYKITRSRLDGKLKLLNLDIEVAYFTTEVFADFSLILKDNRYTTTYTDLEILLKDLDKVTSFKDSQLFISDRGTRYNIDLTGILEADQTFNSQRFSLSFEVELIPENSGFSSYSHLTYFMPKWSTAYKFTHSNHSKLVEPVFTDILHSKAFIEHLVAYGDDPYVADNYFLFEKKKLNFKPKELLSQYTIDNYVTRNYLVGSEELVNFGARNTKIVLKVLDFLYPVELLVSGIYENTFISEVVKVSSKELFQLKLDYSKIFNIEFMSFNTDLDSLEDTFVEVSNAISFATSTETFHYFKRENGDYFELDNNKIVLKSKTSKVLEVFSLPFNTFKYIVLDSKDNILINRNDSIYLGKLDALLDLQIPEDVTYNNTRFIETTFLTSTEYSVDILLKDFFEATEKDLVSVCLKDSEGSCYYINKDLQLVKTEEELFISPQDLVKDILSFEIGMSILTEYLIISLNDYEGHNKKSNIIVHPTISVTKEFSLDLNEELIFIDGDYSVINKNTLSLKSPRRLSLEQLKSNETFKYFYLTSDMYDVETTEDSSFTSLIDFEIKVTKTSTVESISEITSANQSEFLSLDLSLVSKYSTESVPLESYSANPAAFLSSSLVKYISYTTLDANAEGNPSSEFSESTSTQSASFRSIFVEEFPFLYKTSDIEKTTSTISKVEFEIKKA